MSSPSALGRLTSIPPDIEACDAEMVLRMALGALGRDRLALSTSFGPEDVVILDLLCRIEPHPRVFTLDTGRLPDETYELVDHIRKRYGIEVEVYFPDARAVEAMVRELGMNPFYGSLEHRLRCCEVRKVAPLRRALATVDGWITGLRREQAPTRSRTSKISIDIEHGRIWKVAPLADWSEEQVWRHIRTEGLPYHALLDRGYRSVGCAPCTRPVAPGEDPRSGRWWWEAAGSRECGLHVPHPVIRQEALDSDRTGAP